MFEVNEVAGGKLFYVDGDSFNARVYHPDNSVPSQVINLGFDAPYFIIFEEEKLSNSELIAYSDNNGLSKIASEYDANVVFVYPKGDMGWDGADAGLFKELIANSKIGQFYEDGILIDKDRFGRNETTYKIRGTIFRTYLIGKGKSADYIGRCLCTTLEGQYLWGPGEITPAAVILEELTTIPDITRTDIPVLSINNSIEINDRIKALTNEFNEAVSADFASFYKTDLRFIKRWCGTLVKEEDFAKIGVVEEYGVENVKTSPDNCSEYAGTERHEAGYFAWYNAGLLDNGKVPTVIVFHGGGDSALHIAKSSGWWEIAHKYNFLLVAVENHLNLTATETIELIEILKKKYPIDEKRIYASGFSMGGCKSWDMFQEYPEYFAALAPMDATFEVGLNVYGKEAPCLNREKAVPVFYAGGEITPLPELPFQAKKCHDRIKYIFEVNRIETEYTVTFEDRENWADSIWGISGDRVVKIEDKSRDSVLTINYFADRDKVETLALASISGQGHECRQHTCEHAWLFMSGFSK